MEGSDQTPSLAIQERYRHRLSVAGEPLHYVAFAGTKRSAVPLAWSDA